MGWRWEVEAWLKTATNTANDAGYEYVTMYQGYSLLGVWRAYRLAKKKGAGCVAIYWRG